MSVVAHASTMRLALASFAHVLHVAMRMARVRPSSALCVTSVLILRAIALRIVLPRRYIGISRGKKYVDKVVVDEIKFVSLYS